MRRATGSNLLLKSWPLLVILVVTGLWFWPILNNFTRHAYGLPGDPSGALWSFFNSARTGVDLAPPQPVLLGVEAWGLTHRVGEVAAYNGLALLSFLLTAWWGYLFFRCFLPVFPAVFAALLVCFSPYHINQSLQHLGIASIQYLFLLFLTLTALWRKPGLFRGLLAGGALAVVILHDYYLGLIGMVVAGGFSVAYLRRDGIRAGKIVLMAGITALAGVLPFLGAIVLEILRSGTIPPSLNLPLRDFTELGIYRLRLVDFIIPALDHPLAPTLGRALAENNLYGSNLFEQTFWLGLTALGASAWVFFQRLNPLLLAARRIALGLILGGVAFGVSAFGAGDHLLISPLAGLIHHLAPVFRVWARFGILPIIGLSLCVGIALTVLGNRRKVSVVVLVVALIIAETLTLPRTSFDASAKSVPHELITLSQQIPGKKIALYPLAPAGEVQDSLYRSWSRFLNLTLWNLELPWRTKKLDPNAYINPFDPRVIARLAADGVEYLVLDRESYAQGAVPPELLRYYDPDFTTHPLGYVMPSEQQPQRLQEISLPNARMRVFQIQP